MELISELLQDNESCYVLLAYGGWHYFGGQIMAAVLSNPIGHALHHFVFAHI